ncbi:hypothetical protein HPB50_024489 [Hyalomma asiaticum]|uniref:Uncharacterized protein n=1 Tax=Hyalomma asiaticum TaxID=266040 RepID=A0ACB7SZF8_HYAAI|nr:hypothetical protein HPB50_024489 [Hyalomma asiaticum]
MAAPPVSAEDIEAQIREIQARKAGVGKQGNFDNGEGVPLTASANGAYMDEDIYGHTQSKYDGYVTSIAANDDADADDDDYESTGLMQTKKMPLPSAFLAELTDKRMTWPELAARADTYVCPARSASPVPSHKRDTPPGRVLPRTVLAPLLRWDQAGDETPQTPAKKKSSWDAAESSQTPSHARWDETPGRAKGSETPGATPGYSSTRMWEPTPAHATPGHATPGHETPGGTQKGAAPGTPSARRNRWDETPKTERDRTGGADLIQDTPTPSASKRRSRWDETPSSQMGNQTPQTPSAMTPSSTMTPSGVTPTGAKAMAMATPTPGHIMAMTPEQLQAYRWEREIDERNRPLTDEELDAMFPPGYKILQPPAGYVPIRTPARKLTATPTPLGGTGAGIPGAGPGFFFQKEEPVKLADSQPKGNLPPLKPEDLQYFDKLLAEVDEELLSPEEQKERKIMKLLLKIKNGTPPMRKAALRQITDKAQIIEHGLVDEQQKVRTITALALAALAEAATPYGIESFDSVLKPLWKGIRTHRGKGLAAFLKAIGYLIPLMDAEYANYYTREVMLILIREFQSPDEEMKKIVLKVVKQCCATDGVEPQYIKEEVLPHFFKHFWNHRMALDRRNYRQLVDTTVEIANKVGAAEIVNRVVDDLKDENEQYRKMVMETIEKILGNLGATDIDSRLEEQLIDGILYAYQEQTTEDMVMLNGFGTIVNALGKRVKAYLPQICGTILWRLNNKSAKVRQQAADLISRIAVVMKTCQEEKLMGHLGVVLYEYLGEEYPEVLGSILGALKGIVNVIGMHKMTPPIKDLLPRLTPILKNRHEKVQENCIDLVGRIADRGAEHTKRPIRRATVNTFGYIAKAIGPHDVLATLLNNLRVQERQNRVCTTVAIAIVAETCSPFTVLPALMNEYRVPELNVQNGVLKSLSFLFEYIGEMGRDYIYAVTPLLEDALMDRDLVHRQTACAAIQHMSLGVYGFGCEDALVHLLNYVWPNIFETSPHLVQAFMGAVEGLRLALGPIKILQYCLQGLFHPARKVRDVYWKIYNSLYIGGQDALVAGYARVPDDGRNNYIRHELDYIL